MLFMKKWRIRNMRPTGCSDKRQNSPYAISSSVENFLLIIECKI